MVDSKSKSNGGSEAGWRISLVRRAGELLKHCSGGLQELVTVGLCISPRRGRPNVRPFTG